MFAGVFVEPVASVGEEVPGDGVFGVADPGVETGVDPAAGEEPVQRAAIRHRAEEVAHRRADDVGTRVELGVERVQEIVAVAGVELPGVLAVEGDGDQEVAVALLLLDPAEPAHEVADRVLRRHPIVVEADQVAEHPVPEDHRHLAALALDPVGLVERLRRHDPAFAIPAEAALERAGEHVFVGDHPFQPGLDGERRHGFADCHLRRPETGRPASEQPLESRHPERDLLLGVLPVREVAMGQLDAGRGSAGRVDVADQGQDRVVVGRRGELDLAGLGHLPVLWDHAPHHLQLGVEENRLVGLGEVAVLGLEC